MMRNKDFISNNQVMIKKELNAFALPFIFCWLIIKGVAKCFLYILHFFFSNRHGYMPFFERIFLLNSWNKGLVLDGKGKKLSVKKSFEHLAIVGGTGKGKTSSEIIPMIFSLANCDNSILVTDMSGNIFRNTSAYMQKKGYRVIRINPEDLAHSDRFNPLAMLDSYSDISEASHILIDANKPSNGSNNGGDVFWDNGAKKILEVLISLLVNARKCDASMEKYCNLHNVKHLLNSFGDGKALKDFVLKYSLDNSYLVSEFMGLINSPDKTLGGWIATANASLNALGNPDVAKLMASNSIDFRGLGQEKTICYLMIPQEKMQFYSFILSLFYQQFFSACARFSKDKGRLPVFCLMDEFTSLAIPHFANLITTLRAFKVSVVVVLQSLSQLEVRYGRAEAQSMLEGGFMSKLFFGGMSLQTSKELEQLVGTSKSGDYRESIISAEDLRRLKDNQVIFLHSNKRAVRLKVKPYYRNFQYRAYASMGAYQSAVCRDNEEVRYLNLGEFIDRL